MIRSNYTPQHLAEYSQWGARNKIGVRMALRGGNVARGAGSSPQRYGQSVDKRSNPNDAQGPLYHILRVFLIDREGRMRNIYSSATRDPCLVLTDVQEETKLSKQ